MKPMVQKVTSHRSGEEARKEWETLSSEDPDLHAKEFLGHVVWVEWFRTPRSTAADCGAVATGSTYEEAYEKALQIGKSAWGVQGL